MILNLIKGGYTHFFARRKDVIKEVKNKGGEFHSQISEIGKICILIFLNLPNSSDVEEVLRKKNNLWDALSPNTIIVDMSTISPKTIKLSQELKKKNWLLDCPVLVERLVQKKVI